jgi:hypothetical protein
MLDTILRMVKRYWLDALLGLLAGALAGMTTGGVVVFR